MNKDKIIKKALALPVNQEQEEVSIYVDPMVLESIERNLASIMASDLFGKPPSK